MVFPEDQLMQRLFPSPIAGFFESEFAKRGIKIVKGVTVDEIMSEGGNVKSVKLSTGESLEASFVVTGLGAKANTELLKGTVELAADGGVVVDGGFKSSDDSIWAFGDVAAFPFTNDKLARFEHVSNCRQSAAHMVQSVLGKVKTNYDYLPYFYSRIFEYTDSPIVFQFYGETEGMKVTTNMSDPLHPSAVWSDEDGRVRGGMLVNGTQDEYEAIKDSVVGKQEMKSKL